MTQILISPALDGSPLNGGLALVPNGYKHGKHLWLTPHVNTIWDTWKPSTKWKNTGWSETSWLYRLRLDDLGKNKPATFVKQLSPPTGYFGVGQHAQNSMICVGGNGWFYATTTTTTGFRWVDGDFKSIYMGIARKPGGKYDWGKTPILAASKIGTKKIAWLYTIGLRSTKVDPPPPSLFGIAMDGLWGYASWGFVGPGEHPGKIARIFIALDDEGLEDNVFVFAEDGTWKPTRADGTLGFIPADVPDFHPHGADSIFHHPTHGWCGVGYATREGEAGDPGPDISRADWYTDPKSQFYHVPWYNRSAVPVVTKIAQIGGGEVARVEELRTKQACMIGAFVVEYKGKFYLIRGSAVRIAREKPGAWWNPWIGGENVVDEVVI